MLKRSIWQMPSRRNKISHIKILLPVISISKCNILLSIKNIYDREVLTGYPIDVKRQTAIFWPYFTHRYVHQTPERSATECIAVVQMYASLPLFCGEAFLTVVPGSSSTNEFPKPDLIVNNAHCPIIIFPDYFFMPSKSPLQKYIYFSSVKLYQTLCHT